MLNSPYTPIVLLLVLLVLFVWNRWRYDLVAVFGLLCAVQLNVVPVEKAFLGFSHPAVILVAAALVISWGLKSSGALQAILGALPVEGRPLAFQLLMICGIVAFLSAFINNVAAVAIMIPYVVTVAYKSKISPRLYFMPVAFASLLGGLMTLIGTPPNIIIATYRSQLEGRERFSMFDFTPVGLVLVLAGLVFITLTVKIFIRAPEKEEEHRLIEESRDFLTELIVKEDSGLAGVSIHELLKKFDEVKILGIKREEEVMLVPSQFETLREGDCLILESNPETLVDLVGHEKLELQTGDAERESEEVFSGETGTVVEVIVPAESAALGRSSKDLDIRWKYTVNVLGVARAGARIHRQLGDVVYHVGDIVLLQGSKEDVARLVENMGWVFLSDRSRLFQSERAVLLPAALFAGAVAGSYLGFFEITVAFVACAFVYVLLGYVQVKDLYQAIEWPVIVLLACLIPVGQGMESAGSLELVANAIEKAGQGLGPMGLLALIMLITMVFTNIINNAAAAIVMAPVATQLAQHIHVSTDSLLMAVAVAASAAFMTPIGHQSNALVMEPGEYEFKEFFYFGLPLSLLTLIVAIPCIMYFWPLHG